MNRWSRGRSSGRNILSLDRTYIVSSSFEILVANTNTLSSKKNQDLSIMMSLRALVARELCFLYCQYSSYLYALIPFTSLSKLLWCCVVSATSPAIVLDVIDYLVIGIDAALRIKAAAIVIR